MVPLILIAATDVNNAIGRQGQMGWHLSEEFKHFKNTTMGHCVVMGRTTYESIGKPLPGRINLVLSSNPDWYAPDVQRVSSLLEAQAIAQMETPGKPLFVAGGASVYKDTINQADAAVISRIALELLDADTWFPVFDENWMLLSSEERTDEKTEINFTIQRWVKRI